MTSPLTSTAPATMNVAGIRAVLLGGLCAIGVSCFFGSVFAGVWLRVAMLRGATFEQAFEALMDSSGSPGYWFALAPQVLAGVVGGYIAARGGARPIAYAASSSVIYLSFVGATYINPYSQPAPFGYLLISLVLPVLSAILGGVLYVRRI